MALAPKQVPAFYLALAAQETQATRALLADNFTSVSPMGNIPSPNGFAEMVSGFGGWVETTLIVAQGEYVVHTFMFHMTAPVDADIESCDIFRISGGLIQSVKVFNNPADFPAMG